jgi:xylan 1,4-beta-xylosidase
MLKDGVRDAPDVAAFASLDPAAKRLAVMVWHYHDDDIAGPDAAVQLALGGLPPALREARVTHYRIDESHSNAYAAWRRMGAPIAPSAAQYAEMLKASELAMLAEVPATAAVSGGKASLSFTLPRQAVSLVVLDWS